MSLAFADLAMSAPISLADKSYEQAAGELELPDEVVEGIRSAFGAARRVPGEPVREDDAEMMAMAAFGSKLGLFSDSMLRTLRAVRLYLAVA